MEFYLKMFAIMSVIFIVISMNKKGKYRPDLNPLIIEPDFIYDGLDHKYGLNKKHRHHSF